MNVPGGTPAIISCASCTTNCITPIVEVIGRRIGFEKAVMTTVHAYTSSQSIVDGPSKRFRRGRAAAANLVPAATGAAHATTRALPEYAGRFDGIAIRAPIPVGSIADITFVTSRKTTVDEVNQILTEEADTERYAGVLGVSRDPLVSSDIVGDPRASIVDLELTKVIDGDLVKVMSWYDNEWGYANQMVREALSMCRGVGRLRLRSCICGREGKESVMIQLPAGKPVMSNWSSATLKLRGANHGETYRDQSGADGRPPLLPGLRQCS